MSGVPCAHGSRLLAQLELVLETDNLIDEVGFVHPSQLEKLNEDSCHTRRSVFPTNEYVNGELGISQYDRTAFWNDDHKLAISTEALPLLYMSARQACNDVRNRYGVQKSLGKVSDHSGNVGAEADSLLEAEILRHTRALLILSCEFGSAWNFRKLVLSRKQNLSFYVDELRLSRIILSYSPKSGCAWSHRQWVIKLIAEDIWNLHDLISQESELVKDIAEKSKMNYRAWSHRCWLVSYMKKPQVLEELSKSRKWAELHVADNCCFHYRRRLMIKAERENHAQLVKCSTNSDFEVYFMWQEELEWNKLLIRRFIGREALWVHRRFLSQYWMTQFASSAKSLLSSVEGSHYKSLDSFLDEELQLLASCVNASTDGFEDTGLQARHAAAYAFWLFKHTPGNKLPGLIEKMGGLEAVMRALPDKPIIWEDLFSSLQICR